MAYSWTKDTGGTLSTGLVGYWALGESSGNAVDYTGSYNLTQTGTVSAQTGKNGGARGAFPTDNTNYLQNTSVLSLNQNVSVSASVWIYLTGTTTDQAFLSLGAGASGTFEHRVYFNSSNKLTYAVNKQAISANGLVSTTDTLSTSTWYHVVITYNGSTRGMELFINGVSKGTATATSDSYTSSSSVMLGGSYYTPGGNTKVASAPNIYTDELAYHSKIYSSTEISDLYNSGTGSFYMEAAGPANLKSFNGVLKAGIKSINGTAIGSIKSVNGVT